MTSSYLTVWNWPAVHFVGLKLHCFLMVKVFMPGVTPNYAWLRQSPSLSRLNETHAGHGISAEGWIPLTQLFQ